MYRDPAQTTGAGTITGTITDPSSAVVPAGVRSGEEHGDATDRALVTNEARIFVARFLQQSSYEITVTKTGFSKVVRTVLILQVGQT